MDIKEATRRLESIHAAGKPRKARLLGVPVTVAPVEGWAFKIFLSMANPGAGKAAEKLHDVGARMEPWPPQGHCMGEATWDTTLHGLVVEGHLEIMQ